MRPTGRFWTTAGLVGVLTALGVVAARPLALVGAAAVGAWLLVATLDAATRFGAVDDGLAVDYESLGTTTSVDRPLAVRLRVERGDAGPERVTVRAPLPTAFDGPAAVTDGDGDDGSDGDGTGDPRTVVVGPGESTAETTFSTRPGVAGAFAFDRPTVEVAERRGLFTASLRRGTAPTVTVAAPHPEHVHVGQGGQEYATAYGDHRTDRPGSGMVPSELRTYLPGDPVNRIDWKTTARLAEPYVREFDAETDRRTVLVVDHRVRLDCGEPGRTMLDHGREVALGIVGRLEAGNDPLGAYAVGDEGLTARHDPSNAPAGYAAVRRTLYDLTPTAPAASTAQSGGATATSAEPTARSPASIANRSPSPAGAGQGTVAATAPPTTSPARARELADRLGTDEPLGRLRPYLETTDAYVRRVEGDPLFAAVELADADVGGSVWTVLVTDDGDRDGLREAVRLASRGGDHVLAFVTPRVLFEPGAMADPEAAYERYREFETFRRELAATPRTTAFEVAPGDRLDALLASHRRRQSADDRS